MLGRVTLVNIYILAAGSSRSAKRYAQLTPSAIHNESKNWGALFGDDCFRVSMFSPCGASSRVRLVTNGSKSIKGIPAATSQTHKHTQGQRRINGKPNGCIFVSCFLQFFLPHFATGMGTDTFTTG